MLDPTTPLFRKWQDLQLSGAMVGHNRPIGRVTFQDTGIHLHESNSRPGLWRSQLFHPWKFPELAAEVQVSNINISRSIGQDAATCTMSLPNVRPGHYAPVREGIDDDPFGVGYLTPNRGYDTQDVPKTSVYGDDVAQTRWGYLPNALSHQFLPNTLFRTYQGYGSDNFDENGIPRDPSDPLYVHPHNDTQLVLTGVWMSDKVTFTGGSENPTISIEARDLAKLLIEQFIYPKMIPMSRFPLIYCPMPDVDETGRAGNNVARYDTSAPDQHGYYPNGTVLGHHGSDAFDGRPETYWLSHSYEDPSSAYSYEWLQADCDGDPVNEVFIRTVKDGYKVYVSVKEDGYWKGTDRIPYSAEGQSHSHEADIDYVATGVVPSDRTVKIKLPRTYNAQKVRITFTDLQNFDSLPYYPYRVGVREFKCYNREAIADVVAPVTGDPGEISEWSDVIKELCGWAGFTWPDASPLPADPLLGTEAETGTPMRVWGDFEKLGVGPKVCTPGDYFMNKSFMEGIRQVVDFLGAIFYIDHTGGAQFRMPNIWSGGNFICDPSSVNMEARIDTHPIELNDGVNLLEYAVTLDDSQVRSEIVVVGKDPDINGEDMVAGGYKLGDDAIVDFSTVLNGQVRLMMIPSESTKNFATNIECQRMAEMLAVQILFTYRTGSAKIPAHPGLHIDDQIRIYERVTHENTIHYVSGIESSMDLNSGEWTMNLTTHWLGQDPNTDWFLDKEKLTPAVRNLPVIMKRLSDQGVGGGGEVE